MRSDLVFAANDAVSNRFLLCRVISLSARRFHADSYSMNATINDALERVGGHDPKSLVVDGRQDNGPTPAPSSQTDISIFP